MRWLIDEMFPAAVADQLADVGHDAKAVGASELRGVDDHEVFAAAVSGSRTIVTENVNDYMACLEGRIAQGEEVTAVVFARKVDLPRDSGGLTVELADRLHRWAVDHPDPFPTVYWL